MIQGGRSEAWPPLIGIRTVSFWNQFVTTVLLVGYVYVGLGLHDDGRDWYRHLDENSADCPPPPMLSPRPVAKPAMSSIKLWRQRQLGGGSAWPMTSLVRRSELAARWRRRARSVVGQPSVLSVALTLVILSTGLGTRTAVAQFAAAAPDVARRTVVVVPFANISTAEEDDWLGRGIAESVVAELSQREDIRVLDPRRVRAAFDRARVELGSAAEVLRVCRELGADFLVTGGYQRVGDRVRVTARVVEVQRGAIVTSTTVDGVLDDLFELQDRVASDLGDFERARLGAAASVPTPPTAASEAEEPLAPSAVRPESTVEATGGGALGAVRPSDLAPGAPPPPVPPAVMNRNETGQATLRAVRLERELSLDGALDERVYQELPSITGFIQIEPNAGQLATEQTEAWVFFDDVNVYVAARAWDSTPESNWIANEMRRDNSNVLQNEGMGFAFDTFHDRRSAVVFNVTPLGGRMDGQVNTDGSYNRDWNPIWELRTGRFDGGWSFEASVPFKSLRYRPGRAQVWGFQMRRDVLWKNEMSHIVGLNAGLGRSGLLQASLMPALVGLETPQLGPLIEIKPYVIGDVSSDLTASPRVANQTGGNVGIDIFKYGLTQNLTADFTFNTDFAQVEADEQQVNLTRFSLFFPEKREFFLENQGAFAFGTGGRRSRSGGSQDAPILFYSRRIGLNNGLEVPILGGGRLTGRAGAYTIGLLSIQTDDEPAAEAQTTNFSVVRLRRDLLRRSSIGAILTNRSVSTASPVAGSNLAFGFDTALAFYDNLAVNGYWAKTDTTGIEGKDTSYSADLRYNGDRYGVTVEHLFIDERFSPDVGFLRRDDMRKNYGLFRFSPRPRSLDAVRKVTWEGSYTYIADASGFVETREPVGRFGIEFENSDQLDVTHAQTYDFLKQPFEIVPDVVIPVGGYDFHNTGATYSFGSQRRLSGNLGVEHGTFYNGTKTTVTIGGSGRGAFGGGRVEISSKLSLEPGMSLNWVDVPRGDFMTTLVTTRATYTMTPLMFASALVQYNSDRNALSTNIRLRWEYRPGSELFIVYNEQRDTLVPRRFSELENRAFIVKLNRLFRF